MSVTSGSFFDVAVTAHLSGVEADDLGTIDLLQSFAFTIDTMSSNLTLISDLVNSPLFTDAGGPDDTFIAGFATPGIADDPASPQDILLTTITFQAGATGTASAHIYGDNLSLYGDGFQYQYNNLFNPDLHPSDGFPIDASFEVQVTSNPVPEPATMLLLGTGLAGLGLVRRRKSA